jgi:ABC-type ATPase with predicted acetyltransferase domain
MGWAIARRICALAVTKGYALKHCSVQRRSSLYSQQSTVNNDSGATGIDITDMTTTRVTNDVPIAVEQVSKSFPLPDGKGEFKVLGNINLKVPAGEVVAFKLSIGWTILSVYYQQPQCKDTGHQAIA